MTRTSWTDLKTKKLSVMTADERKEYDRAYAEAQLAAEVGERIHAAREAAGLSQRELARRMGTSQAAIDRLESVALGDPHDPAKGRYCSWIRGQRGAQTLRLKVPRMVGLKRQQGPRRCAQ